MEYLLLLVGFGLLIKGADLLVDGAASIASKLGISSLVIGLTVVAFGTSAPEFVVSFMSAFSGNTDLAISNVVGSNIANIALILGITTLISPIKMPGSTVKKEIPFAVIISFVLLLLINDVALGFGKENTMGLIDGIILMLFFIYFLYYTYTISKNKSSKDEEGEIRDLSKLKSSIFIFLGLAGLIFGGNLIVENAVKIAQSFGLSNAFIGVTIIAIGTSLPELASSIIAALKKNADMAIGTIIGSNIFNILWILGFSSLFFELKSYAGINIDLMISLFLTVLLIIFALIHRKYFLDKWNGVIFIFIYIAYISYLIVNL